ncbi:hypothetical protein LCGC14_1599460 [marine sediment metagenome]|uniref:Uncharacterized protein n=1 Tax=marine sediment metagenome TaxID=412755 RepID=A0A0F9IBJ4_9ZZZZ
MSEKICPLMSSNVGLNFEEVNCREDCALWITVYSTELNSHQCCSLEMMALKNSEGLYRV